MKTSQKMLCILAALIASICIFTGVSFAADSNTMTDTAKVTAADAFSEECAESVDDIDLAEPEADSDSP